MAITLYCLFREKNGAYNKYVRSERIKKGMEKHFHYPGKVSMQLCQSGVVLLLLGRINTCYRLLLFGRIHDQSPLIEHLAFILT